MAELSLYERVGGTPFFVALVERFYDAVAHDEILRPMYPDDLAASKRHLAMFLVQYWGGPTTYADERGHPRLRMRHAPFVIDADARDAWLRHMGDAVATASMAPEDREELERYLEMAAHQLRNA